MATKKAARSEHKITKRKDGRYAVRTRGGKFLNGDAKVEALAKAGLITAPAKKAAPAEENA